MYPIEHMNGYFKSRWQPAAGDAKLVQNMYGRCWVRRGDYHLSYPVLYRSRRRAVWVGRRRNRKVMRTAWTPRG